MRNKSAEKDFLKNVQLSKILFHSENMEIHLSAIKIKEVTDFFFLQVDLWNI